jgi:hypothetical protein
VTDGSHFPHHVAVSRPRRRTVLDLVLGRKPTFAVDWGRCTECGVAVTGAKPIVKVAETYHHDGPTIWSKGPDEYVGFDLEPCDHRARRLTVIQQGYESIAVNDIVAEDRSRRA